jgi:hypothetical protein
MYANTPLAAFDDIGKFDSRPGKRLLDKKMRIGCVTTDPERDEAHNSFHSSQYKKKIHPNEFFRLVTDRSALSAKSFPHKSFTSDLGNKVMYNRGESG